jgi:diadenosine tetraphosphate (Ap4A) HIT family hydrolase
MNNCVICNHANSETGRIAITDHWLISLASDQGYLGRCYVTLRKHKGSLVELSDVEWDEYIQIVRRLERAVSASFGASPSNWACMMNNAYQDVPANPHVHWHFRPRYRSSVVVNGVTFSDPMYGYHYDREQRREVDGETFHIILRQLKKAYGQA